MLLNKLLTWVLHNPVLLTLQNLFISPVLKRLPKERYEKIRYSKNILFKIVGIGAGTLACRHLARNNVELSLRYACEIIANQGYIFYSQNWKAYLLYVGLIHAYRRDYEKASIWLAEGISKQSARLINSVKTQSYPDMFSDWLDNNLDNLKDPESWRLIFFEARDNEKDIELLLIYISICIFSLQLSSLVVEFFENCEIKHHSDWKKMIVYRQAQAAESRYSCELTESEIWQGTYPDISQKLGANILYKAFSKKDFGSLQYDADFDALSKFENYQHVSHQMFPLIMNSCNLLNQSKYNEVISLLEPIVSGGSEYLSSIGSRRGPTKLFLAGFGWSGSSAVHDACRGYRHTKDMPGAGDLPALNIGADSEPMLHQGAGSLNEIVCDLKSLSRISETVLKRFFKNYVLLMPSFSYLEYKTVNASKSIIGNLGFERYYLIICEFLYHYALAMRNADMALAIDSVESFQESIVNAMFSDDDIVFFNNSIFAHRAKIMENVRGRSFYIVVNRKMSDQFCDQMRSNKFFNATFLEFYLVKLSRVIAYKAAKNSSRNKDVEFVDIMFESWVKDEGLRENISRRICECYDKNIESQYFDPKRSQNNINISRSHLGTFDRACLGLFEKVGMSI